MSCNCKVFKMSRQCEYVCLVISFCCLWVSAFAQNPVTSLTCSGGRPPVSDPGCSTVEAGDCTLLRREGGQTEDVELHVPANNSRSRYRTCIADVPVFGETCEVDRIRFEDRPLVVLRGPRRREIEAYNYFRLFSRNFLNDRAYPRNELATFNVLCNSEREDSILSVTLDFHVLDTPQNCTVGERCVDFIEMQYPTGGTCTTCGSKPLQCQECVIEKGDRAPELREILHFPGNQIFFVKFKSDRIDPPSFSGFQFLTSCVEKSYYGAPNCVNPTGPSGRRRSVRDAVPGLVRARRSYRIVWIFVLENAAVSYSDYTVRVFKDNVWLYKFPNTRYFQVFNFVEGFLTFSRSAPEGRTFPGFGVLKVGRGIIQYIQTGVRTEFLPTAAETEIIIRLRRRIVGAIAEFDPIVPDPGDPEPPRVGPRGAPGPSEIEQADRDAVAFGLACNGILRADACVYQELFLGGATDDCLI